MEPDELLEKTNKERRRLSDLLPRAKQAELQRQTYMRHTAERMLINLPEKEDEYTSNVDLGYNIANVVSAVFRPKRAGERIMERVEYRENLMEEDRQRRDHFLEGLDERTAKSLHHLVATACRASTLREFLNSVGTLTIRKS